MAYECSNCKHATLDCAEYYGGGKQWFVDGCKKDMTAPKSGECEEYKGHDFA